MYTGKETKLGKEGRKDGGIGLPTKYPLDSSRKLSLNSLFLSFYHRFSFPTCTLKIPTSILPYTPPRLLKTNKQTKDKQKREKELTDEFKRLPGILTPTDPHGRHFFHPPFRTVSLGASFHITWAGFPFFSDIHVLLVCFLPSIHSLSLSLFVPLRV